jgi:chromosome segregation ATPase
MARGMTKGRDRDELHRNIAAVEGDLEAAATQAREAEDALERLKESEAAAAGRLGLAVRAQADLEQRRAQLQGELRQAEREREAAEQAFRHAVDARDRAAVRASEAIADAVAAIADLDDARARIQQALNDGPLAGADLPTTPPVEPHQFAEEWSHLEKLVLQRANFQLEQDLVHGAARNSTGQRQRLRRSR